MTSTVLRRWWRDERGSSALELTLLTPGLLAVLLLIVLGARIAHTHLLINDAAAQSARAATLAATTSQAERAARSSAHAALGKAGMKCHQLTVTTELGELRPGATVITTVTCHIGLDDLTALGVPGTTEASARAASRIDPWRSTTTKDF